MTTLSLIDQLEAEFPIKREVKLDGKVTVWIWRLEIEKLQKILGLHALGDGLATATEIVVSAVGDESGPGSFDNERGRRWLKLRPNAVLELAQAVREFNELDGPSEDRKKKSDPTSNSEDCSTSASDLESNTLDD